jgi:hypothetical protein
MISILFIATDNPNELASAWDDWMDKYNNTAPQLIIGHNNLCYALDPSRIKGITENKNRTKVRYNGILVTTIDDFESLHHDDVSDEND